MEDQRSETFRALEVVTLRIGRAFGGEGGVSDTRSERSRRGATLGGSRARGPARTCYPRAWTRVPRWPAWFLHTSEPRDSRPRVGCRSAPWMRAGSVRGEGRRPAVEARGARTRVHTCARVYSGSILIVTCAVDVIE